MRLLVTLAVALVAAAPAPAGIITGHVNNGFDSRFDIYSSGFQTANPVPNTAANFIGLPYDFSGVGYSGNSLVGMPLSVSLVSPHYFVGAWHVAAGGFHFNPGQPVVFINKPPVGSPALRTFTVATMNRLVNPDSTMSDVLVGRLTTGVAPSDFITRYSVPNGPQATFINQPLLVYGENPNYGAGNAVHVGQGNIAAIGRVAFSPPDDPSPTTGYIYPYNSVTTGSLQLIGGDSGSPSFIPLGGTLGLVGAHFGVDNTSMLNVDSFLPDYISQINAILAADGESLSVVPLPEPSSFILVGAAGAAYCWRRVRRRQAA